MLPHADGLASGDHHTIIVPDAGLLFSGDYKRAGLDLVLSKSGHDYVVHDYFKGHNRATLASPDGAHLSGDLVYALTGEVQVAQAGGGPNAATVIGRVTKLTGSATAIRNGVSIQLNVGDNVNKGDVVQAGAESSLGLTFIDGTVFGLSANARMVLNEMVYDPNGSANSSLLSLVQGTITFVAGETAKHGDMKVDTPVATMGIRGTAVLVEIGFEVPGQGANAPPVKFQVLVEPGGRTGSYVLYSKTQPDVIIGTVDQAGQVTSVTGLGDTSTAPATPLNPLAQAIIQQTLQQYFPNYVPSANPQSNSGGTGSSPPAPVPGSSNPDKLQFSPPPDLPVGVPTTVPISVPGAPAGTPPISVTVTNFNAAPTIVVTPVANTANVDIAGQVTITDPDQNDVAVPYVPGTGRILGVAGPSNIPAGVDLASLVTIDPATGHVSYNPATLTFLGQGQSVVVTFGFDSQSGPSTFHETLTLTIDGTNDAPVVTAPLTTTARQGSAPVTANLLAGASDVDDGETATLTVSGVHYAVNGGALSTTAPAGVTLTGSTLSVDPVNAAFSHLAAGQTTTIVVTYDVTDVNGASVPQTETVTVTGTNDAPVVTAALTSATTESAAPLSLNLLAGASDPDDGETATLTVSGVHYVVNGGASSTTAPAGVTLTGATLGVDPTNPAFAHLAAGQTTTIVVTYNVTDVHGATVPQTETITVTGTNEAPLVTAALTSATTEGAAAFTLNLLSGASDPDGGETATLSVSGVHYAVNGGTSSTTAPAGVTLTGATLGIDPTNPAFAHLAAGQTTTIVVSYNVTDINGASVPQTETVTITGTNEAPVVAAALTSSTTEGAAAFALNLLSGATDPDDGETATLSVSSVHYAVNGGTSSTTAPAGVTLTGATLGVDPTNPAFTHLAAGQTTTIVVTYNVTDVHGASVPQTETITVTGTNEAPLVAAALTSSTTEGAAAFTTNLLAGATDPDDGETATLTVSGVHYTVDGGTSSTTAPTGVTLTGATLGVDPTNPAFTHLAAGQTTTIVVSYNVTDVHGASVPQTETITVTGTNEAPVVAAALTSATTEGAAAFTTNLLAGATDPDDGETATLSVSGVHYAVNGGTSSTTAPAGVTLTGATLGIDPTNPAFAHLAAGQTTTIVVSYNVTDVNGASVPQTETITVTGTNEAPVVAAALTSATTEGAAAFALNLLSGASDPDDGETATLTVTGVHYAVNGGVSSTTAPAGITLTGATLGVDPTNAAFAHLGAGQTTTIVVSYNVTDVNGASVPQTETITVTGTNEAPVVAAALTSATTEGAAAFALNLLSGATDPDDGETATLSVSGVHYAVNGGTSSTTAPAGVTLTGATLGVDPTNPAFTHLAAGQTTTIVVSYNVTDVNGASVPQTETITVTGTNEAPVVAAALTSATTEGAAAFATNLLAGATDPDDGETATLTVTGVHYAINGGASSLTAPAGITLTGATLGVDPTNPAFAHLAAGQTTTIVVSYNVTDVHGASVPQTETITITGTNEAPLVAAALTSSTTEGAAAFTTNLLAGASDPDDGETATLTVSGVHYAVNGGASSTTAPAGVTLTGATLGVDPTNPAFAHLAAGQTTTIVVSYNVTDVNGASVPQTETVTITGTNEAPLVAAALTSSTTEGAAAFTTNLLAGATDPDDGETATLTVSGVHYTVNGGASSTTAPAGVTLTGATLGVDPTNPAFAHLAAGQTTTIVVTYDVTDAHGATVSQTETITVTGTNEAPVVAAALTSSTTEGAAAFTTILLAGATDPDDGETATLTVTGVHYAVNGGASSLTAPAGITLTGATLGVDPTNVAFAHLAAGQTTTIVVSYNVTDVNGASVPQTETVTITGTNEAPVVAAALTSATTEGAAAFTTNLLAGATDPDDGETATLTVSGVHYAVNGGTSSTTAPVGVTLTGATLNVDPGNAAFSHLAAGQTTTIVVTYDVTDVNGASVPQTETITVTGTNDAPVVAAALTSATTAGAAAFTTNLLTGATDPDDGETATLSVSGVHYVVNGGASSTTAPAGITLTGGTLGIDPTNPAFAHLAAGQTTTIVVSYNVTDVNGASVPQTETITVTGTNHAPTVSAAVAGGGPEDTTFAVNLLQNATDVDDGSVLHVANLVWTDAPASASLPAGFVFSGNSITVDATGGVYQGLAQGQTFAAHFSYDVVDQFGALVHQTAIVTITGTNDAPAITSVTLNVTEGGTVVLSPANVTVNDPDSTSFTFTASNVIHGVLQVTANGTDWVDSTSFTSADLAAGHVRFVDDGSALTPSFSLTASDGIDNSPTVDATINFTTTNYHLTSTAGVSIDISPFGATSGFTFPGAGNVTTPGTPEDRIALGYTVGESQVVLNADPMLGTTDFTPVSSTLIHNADGSNAVSTVLGAGNNVTLTQTITLGGDANYFTTTVDVFNGGTTTLNNVRFLRNIDPDQDQQAHGDFTTLNDVVQNPTGTESFAIVSAVGPESGVQVALVGLGGDWRGSVFGFTNTDPFDPGAFDSPVDPDGAQGDLAISLTYNFGTILAGQTVEITYITTDNVATAGSNALFGTTGNDVIDGLGGDDLMIGLGGADTFVIKTGYGHDTIYDFTPGTDKIELDFSSTFDPDNTASFNAWLATHATQLANGDVIIDPNPSNPGQTTILLKNTPVGNLHASDFIVHFTDTAPVAVADSNAIAAGASGTTGNLLANDSDTDNDSLTISSVTADAATSTTFTVEGTYGELIVTRATGAYTYTLGTNLDQSDPTHAAQAAAVRALGTGVTAQELFSYTANDGHLDSNVAELSITITGSNAAPVVTSALTTSTTEGAPAFTANLLGGATDPNDGETATLTVTGVHYVVDGGTSSTTPPAGVTLTGATLNIDPTNAAFNHLAAGQTSTIVVSYNVTDVNGASVPQTETVTITGTNDAPVVAAALTRSTSVGAAAFTTNLLTGASDPDTGETATLTVTGVHYVVDGGTSSTTPPTGVTLTGATLGVDPTNAAFSHIAAGQSSTIVVSYNVTDVHNVSVPQTETITITGSNSAPVVTAALTSSTTEGAPAFTANLLSGASDPNDGETATLTVTGVHYVVDGGTSSTTPPAGVTLTGATLNIDPTNAAFNHLAAGQTSTIVVSYNVTDVNGASVPQTETVTITGTNDAPVVAAALTRSTSVGAAAFTTSLLTGASDPDTGETATLTISGVHYVVDGGTSSTTPPAGVTLTGATLSVDPTNAAFSHIAAGQSSIIVVSYNVTDVHNVSVPQTETITITGSNSAPVVTSALTSSTTEGAPAFTANLLSGASDPNDGETATLTVTGVHYVVDGGTSSTTPPAGVTLTGATLNIDPTNAAFNHLAAGQTSTIVVSYNVTDVNGASVPQTETVTITGTNDAPVVAAALTRSTSVGAAAFTTNLLTGASDPDTGETATLTVTGVHYVVDGGTSSTTPPAGVTLTGATLSVDPTNAAFSHIAAGQSSTIVVSYNVTDVHNVSVPQTETITITGSNAAPVVTSALTSSTTEGAPAFTANLLSGASDPNDGETATLTVTGVHYVVDGGTSSTTPPAGVTLTGATLNIDPTNAAFNHLAAGQTSTIVVSYNVTDVHGASVPQTETVTITGTNDAPVITGGSTTGSVTENQTVVLATGQLTAVDPDDGATATWTVVGGSGSGSADYHFRMDSLVITRGAGASLSTTLDDEFSDGAPPPSSPPFGSGQTTTYGGVGGFTESGGELHLDDSNAVSLIGVGTTDPFIGQTAVVLTNIDPSNTTAGLKQNTTFNVTGVFDLVLPNSPRQEYGIRLTDRLVGGTGTPPDQPGDDTISLTVLSTYSGNAVVALRNFDFLHDTVTTLALLTLAPPAGADQIALHLNHVANTNIVTASFDYLHAGTIISTQTFTTTAPIFNNENWTRAEIIADAPATNDSVLSGTYGTLNVTQSGAWTYTLDNSRAATQALAQGEHRTETFTIQVADQFGATDSRVITIDVAGSNDAPVVAAALTRSTTEGAAAFTTNLLTGASDPDNGETATLTVSGVRYAVNGGTSSTTAPAGVSLTGATLSVDPTNAAFNHLPAGQTATIVVSYNVIDVNGASVPQTETITITGTNDAPVVAAALTSSTTKGAAAYTTNLLTGASDPDDGETATLTVTGVHYVVDGGASSTTAPAGVTLTGSTLGIDPTNSAFNHLAAGQSSTIVVSYNVTDSHGVSVPQTETITITGSNAAPVVAAALTSSTTEGAPAFTANLLSGASDPNDGETATLTVTGVHYAVNGGTSSTTAPAGVTLTGATLGIDPPNAAFNHLAAGQSSTIVVSYNVTDVHGASVPQTETITITGTNDAPVVAAALTTPAHVGDAAFTTSLLTGASDPDDGETATLTVTGVHYAVNGGTASTTAPAGITLTGATLGVDPTNAAFANLAAGQTSTIVVSYNVTDSHGVSVPQTETVTITGSNSAPVIASGTDGSGSIGVTISAAAASSLTPGAATILNAGPGLISGLPGGGSSYGTLALPAGDDNSSGAIDITSVFGSGGINFFGQNFTSLYINNNGNLTFSSPSSTYTPTAINAGFNNPIIAPFWADVDTRGAGAVYYTLDSVDGVMTITWNQVGYFSSGTDRLNSFQIVLLNEGGGNFDIQYRYQDINWTTGSASGGSGGLGGTVARAGYSAGDGEHYYELPQSGNQSAILALPTTPGNTGVAGVDGFEVRDGAVAPSAVTTTGVINFSDANLNDIHTASVTTPAGTLGSLTVSIVTDSTGSGTGGQFSWTYNADATDVQTALLHSANGTQIETFHVTISDGHGGTVTQDVSVTLTASNADVWTGQAGGTDFDNAGNWNKSHVPTAAEVAYIPAAALVNLNLATHSETIGGLHVATGGELDMSAATSAHTLEIDGPLVNNGVVLVGQNATLHVDSATENTGSMTAHAGTIKIDGAVTGHGSAVINGGTIEFGNASDATVKFTASAQDTLVLDDAGHFTGTVSGLSISDGDTIRLGNVSASGAVAQSDPSVLQFNFASGNTDALVVANYATGSASTHVLNATAGNDILFGGSGADNFVFNSNASQDVVTNFTPGQDHIELNFTMPFSQGDDTSFQQWLHSTAVQQQGADTLIHLNGESTLLLTGVTLTNLHVGDFIVHPSTSA